MEEDKAAGTALIEHFVPQSLPTTKFPHHLFVRQFQPAVQQSNPAATMIAQGLDVNEPLIPQIIQRLQDLQTPTEVDPYPRPVAEWMSTVEFWEAVLSASRAQTLIFYQRELQSVYRGMGRLNAQHDALATRMVSVEARTARVEGTLNRLFGGLCEVVTSSWSIAPVDCSFRPPM